MMTTGDIVRNKYQKHIREHLTGDWVPRAVALFVLHMACADMEEVWADEYDCLQHRHERCEGELVALRGAVETLQAGLEQVMLENDALGAECNRLRMLTVTASSLPVFVQMEAPAEGASLRQAQRPATPTRPPGRPKTQGKSTPKPPPVAEPVEDTEVGETASVDPTQRFDWTAALTGILSSESLQNLDNGTLKWRNLKKSIQTELILEVCRSIHRRIGDLSQTLFEQNRPHWMTSVGSWTNTLHLSWNNALQTVGVQPNNRPLRMRIGHSASST